MTDLERVRDMLMEVEQDVPAWREYRRIIDAHLQEDAEWAEGAFATQRRLEAELTERKKTEECQPLKAENARLREELDERVGEMDEEIRGLHRLLRWAMGFVSPEAAGVEEYREARAALQGGQGG